MMWTVALLVQVAVYQQAPGAVLPDDRVTPGVVRADVTVAMLCDSTRTVREQFRVPLSRALRDSVAWLYGVPRDPSQYQLDHRVPLAVGGCARCVGNLWPQPMTPAAPGAHEKDRLEVATWRDVCRGRLTLAQAQARFLGNWYVAWLQWVGAR